MGDYYNIIHTAKEEAERIGLEKGLEKGRAEGHAQAQLEIARKMLAAGISPEQIVQFTGLSVEEVSVLKR